jgi:hypothetical protein
VIDRRDFLKAGALAATGSLLAHGQKDRTMGTLRRLTVENLAPDTARNRLAAIELIGGLRSLGVAPEVEMLDPANRREGNVHFILAIEPVRFKGQEEYEISAAGKRVSFNAASDQALLYSIFDFLERQGVSFGIDGAVFPVAPVEALTIPASQETWTAAPNFAVRGLLPWPDFLNCISVYNDEDFKAYFANMLRMRFNMFGMHAYTSNDPLAESYLSFDFAGAGHHAALEDTTMTSWGYLPQRTSTFKMGAAEFFDRETFGSDATRLAADNWDIAERTTKMLSAGFSFASSLGIRTGIGFEPYQSPSEIMRALPPEAKTHPGGLIESPIGKDLLERRLADLLERYPMVDYVWLWEDEGANWDSRTKNIPLSVTPFQQARDFLRRNAPKKQLVLAGWGGVVRNFQSLHQRLPGDIVFAALSDSLGWDPVSEEYGKLEGRERWPIPWLEDDPSMWLPQFRASRFESDMKRAKGFGCQGMLGIHWRHRIVDPTATYFSRAAWNPALTAADHYRQFSAAQVAPSRAATLAGLFVDCDQNRKTASTFLGSYGKDGHADQHELTGDYDEGFVYENAKLNPATLDSQRQVALDFKKLLYESASATEKERIGYFSGFVNLSVSYCDALNLAHKLGEVLANAVKLRTAGKEDDARNLVLHDGVPLWLAMAPLVRQTMLAFENIISTRNDQGQLASMQNKFVRISLERLRLSIKEFLGDLPPEMTQAYDAATSAKAALATRIFIPTRPSILPAGESARIFIVVPTEEFITDVHLHFRCDGIGDWVRKFAPRVGRHVYEAQLGPFEPGTSTVEYVASAAIAEQAEALSAPLDEPQHAYRLNIMKG